MEVSCIHDDKLVNICSQCLTLFLNARALQTFHCNLPARRDCSLGDEHVGTSAAWCRDREILWDVENCHNLPRQWDFWEVRSNADDDGITKVRHLR